MEKKFEVEFLEDAVKFMDGLDSKSREKIYFNIRKAQLTNDPELFKKLTATIWEFRTLYNRACYRLFAFWDKTSNKKTIVIATHGLIKKTGKTPKTDLQLFASKHSYRKKILRREIANIGLSPNAPPGRYRRTPQKSVLPPKKIDLCQPKRSSLFPWKP